MNQVWGLGPDYLNLNLCPATDWPNNLAVPCLNLLICKMELTMVSTSQGYCQNQMN